MNLWQALQQHPALRTVDLALGHSLQRLDPSIDPLVLAAAVLAAHAVTQGHAGLRVQRSIHWLRLILCEIHVQRFLVVLRLKFHLLF